MFRSTYSRPGKHLTAKVTSQGRQCKKDHWPWNFTVGQNCSLMIGPNVDQKIVHIRNVWERRSFYFILYPPLLSSLLSFLHFKISDINEKVLTTKFKSFLYQTIKQLTLCVPPCVCVSFPAATSRMYQLHSHICSRKQFSVAYFHYSAYLFTILAPNYITVNIKQKQNHNLETAENFLITSPSTLIYIFFRIYLTRQFALMINENKTNHFICNKARFWTYVNIKEILINQLIMVLFTRN